MENKTGKYFKYAIGEILLVIIGILIALQINSWNENRKAIQNEYKIVGKMIEQTKSDSTLLSNSIGNIESRISNIEYYMAVIQGTADSLKQKNFSGWLPIFTNINDGTHLVRNHLDDFKEINDFELRELLMEYYYLSTMRNKAINILNLNMLNNNLPHYHSLYEDLKKYDTTSTFEEMQDFLKKSKLESYILVSKSWLENVLIQAEKLYNKNQEVLKELEQYKNELVN